MSDILTNAQVNLQVNGQQAEETLLNLRKRALDLTNEIARVSAEGDKVSLKKLRRELNDTKRQIKEMESATMQVDSVLRKLDKAAPSDLQKALATLQKQLQYMERGSDVWQQQTQRIRMVKDEIARVNSELARSQSLLERFNSKWQEWQTVAVGAIAGASGIVMAGRAAVQAYAEMEQEEANVRKFTGMTQEQVAQLNEEFRKLDTRSGRDQLNMLAQEAGRLGKSSLEDVLGFVKAADKINVALDDLGEGATLTLSKLTTIFGDEQRMGTERSLLAVGSVINELSQNCTASAPYLAAFAQRLAGVGAQADMTIPQIMGFAAVLDSQGQKVEMSATAMSKLIMSLFKNTEQIAKATGLNLQQFQQTLEKSTNEGLLMLIQRLHELGGIDVLAPVFSDMGENGARASAVIAALAGNIDKVIWEQQEAQRAFEEGTSVTNEFNVQNTTVQAGLDKARKSMKEMAIALGEELMPVMRHVVSSTSATMRLMLQTVRFLKENRGAIVTLTAGIVAYTIATNAASVAQKGYNAVVKVATTLQHAFNAATKSNPLGLIAAALATAIVAFMEYRRHLRLAKAEADAVGQAEKSAGKEYATQKATIDRLSEAVRNETLSLTYRKKALQELQAIVPAYHGALSKEGKLINDNKEAIDKYLDALKKKMEMQAYQDKLQELYSKRAATEMELDEAKLDYQQEVANAPKQSYNAAGQKTLSFSGIASDYRQNKKYRKMSGLENDLSNIDGQIEKVLSKIGKLPEKVEIPVVATPDTGDTTTPVGDGKDKFKLEEEWKEREEALNRIAYAKGEKNYEAYTNRMLEIEVEFNKRKLQHTDLVGNEQVTIEAAYQEALKKQRQHAVDGTVEMENSAYAEQQRILNQRYVDGEMSARTYQDAMEMLELEHLRKLTLLYEEGSKERLKAEQRYHSANLKNQEKHLKEAKQVQERFREMYFTKAFTITDEEGYKRDLQHLQLVFKQMLTAAQGNKAAQLRIERAFQEAKYQLAHKYNVKLAKDEVNQFKQGIDDSINWLNSDAGQAMIQSIQVLLSGMSEIFSGINDLISAELEIQNAAIEQRYEKEKSLAEGNKSQEVSLEKQKQAELGKAKKEANKKMFALQVMEAVAQTAMSAISAYQSAAAIPIVGFVMAPLAAAMALAAGAIQIATIKKQQQASESVGYSEGGYTKPGAVNEPAGVVHAGEWVASQKLLRDPKARAMVEVLEKAQRTNTSPVIEESITSARSTNSLGRLSSTDVSNSITAQQQVASASSRGELALVAAAAAQLSKSADQMTKRISEPFVTVNTVLGDSGILKAQDDYNMFIRNKTPKSQR